MNLVHQTLVSVALKFASNILGSIFSGNNKASLFIEKFIKERMGRLLPELTSPRTARLGKTEKRTAYNGNPNSFLLT